MPQISPMKWFMLNMLTQSSIIQIISFLSMKKTFNTTQNNYSIFSNKLSWKW